MGRTLPDFNDSNGIVPSQFFDLFRHVESTGERRFWLNYLERAMNDLVKAGPQIQRETREWLATEGVWPGSFEYVCELFGVNPDVLRIRLATLSRRDLPRRSVTGSSRTRGVSAGRR